MIKALLHAKNNAISSFSQLSKSYMYLSTVLVACIYLIHLKVHWHMKLTILQELTMCCLEI